MIQTTEVQARLGAKDATCILSLVSIVESVKTKTKCIILITVDLVNHHCAVIFNTKLNSPVSFLYMQGDNFYAYTYVYTLVKFINMSKKNMYECDQKYFFSM